MTARKRQHTVISIAIGLLTLVGGGGYFVAHAHATGAEALQPTAVVALPGATQAAETAATSAQTLLGSRRTVAKGLVDTRGGT